LEKTRDSGRTEKEEMSIEGELCFTKLRRRRKTTMVTDDEIRGNLRSVWTVEVEEVWSQKFEGIMKGDE
jgi:hypothetical protein